MIVEHVSKDTGKKYLVDLAKKTCTCLDFNLRQRKNGGLCKHLIREQEKMKENLGDYSIHILQDNDAVHFVEKYGEDILVMLKSSGIVYEEHGKLFLL